MDQQVYVLPRHFYKHPCTLLRESVYFLIIITRCKTNPCPDVWHRKTHSFPPSISIKTPSHFEPAKPTWPCAGALSRFRFFFSMHETQKKKNTPRLPNTISIIFSPFANGNIAQTSLVFVWSASCRGSSSTSLSISHFGISVRKPK